MLTRLILAAIISVVSAGSATCQDGVSVDEILMLLRLGVPSAEVLQAVRERGGPLSVSEDRLKEARTLRADDDLLNAMAANLLSRQKRVRLARDFKVHAIGMTDLNLLVPEKPSPWTVERHTSPRGILITLRPHDHQGRDWLTAPGMFVLIQEHTPFPVACEPYLARKLSRVMAKHLLGWGARLDAGTSARGRIGRREVPEHKISVGDPRRKFKGELVVRTRVLKNGTVILVGFACGDSERDAVRELFQRVAESLDIPAEDL